jgi:hypothetical protein
MSTRIHIKITRVLSLQDYIKIRWGLKLVLSMSVKVVTVSLARWKYTDMNHVTMEVMWASATNYGPTWKNTNFDPILYITTTAKIHIYKEPGWWTVKWIPTTPHFKGHIFDDHMAQSQTTNYCGTTNHVWTRLTVLKTRQPHETYKNPCTFPTRTTVYFLHSSQLTAITSVNNIDSSFSCGERYALLSTNHPCT